MITTRGLARTFKGRGGEVNAVRGVDIDVAEGEIVGFLGPNGAGKTTTLRMLTTLLAPTAGTATVAGHDLRTDPDGVRRDIGYVAQGSSTERTATVREELLDQAALYRMPRAAAVARTAELIRDFELDGFDDKLIKEISGGQKRRLEVALGMVHSPKLVFLDEPTTGLDPQSRANLWQHVRNLRDNLGSTVFITTHYLEEADALCDRVLILDEGTIIASGTTAELKEQNGGDVIAFTFAGEPGTAHATLAELLPDAPIEVDHHTVRVTVPDGDQRLPELFRELEARGLTITATQLTRPSLDDVFLSLTGRSLRDA
ncbi:MAG: ATP-binding cassette domain-containing protein [Thermoleophilia bacterium]|nr:ATP-binding cassette domain-containing protein [Thermoleophilia bacterium]